MTPILTVLASQLRRTRPAMIGSALCTFALFVVLQIRDKPLAVRARMVTDPETGQRVVAIVRDLSVDLMASVLLISLAVAVPLLAVLFAHSDSEKLHVSLPTRVLRLPFATWKLVAVFMAFGLMTVGTIACYTTLLIQSVTVTPFAWYIPVMVSLVAVSSLQCWAFTFGDTNPKSAAATFALGIGAIVFVVRKEEVFTFLGEAGLFAATLAAIGIVSMTYCISVLGVRINRTGGLSDMSGALARQRSARVRSHPFNSAKDAQRWYEHRLYGWQLPITVVAIMLAYFMGMPILVAIFKISNVTGSSSTEGFSALFEIDWFSGAQFVTTGTQITAVAGGVLVGGLMFMRAGTWNTQSTYLLTRPLSTKAIARARLSAVARSIALSLSIMMVFVLLGELYLKSRGDSMLLARFLHQGYEHVYDPLILTFFWGTLLLALWVGVWSANLGWALAIFGVTITPALALVWLLGTMGMIPESGTKAAVITAFQIGSRLGALLLIAGAVWAFVQAQRLRLLHRHVKWVAVAAWLAYSVPFLYYGLTYYKNLSPVMRVIAAPSDWAIPFPHPIDWILWAGLSVLPIAPLFTHAYFLERARHR